MGAYTRILPLRKIFIIVIEFLETSKTFTTIYVVLFIENVYASVKHKRNFLDTPENVKTLVCGLMRPKIVKLSFFKHTKIHV